MIVFPKPSKNATEAFADNLLSAFFKHPSQKDIKLCFEITSCIGFDGILLSSAGRNGLKMR
jgi:hypothetical protein